MSESLRLFLVEDDDDIALMVRKAFERVGHRVARCRAGADALTVLGHDSFDLVLLDNDLLDMPGLELLQELQQQRDTPALMLITFGDEQLAAHVLRAGALDYVVKGPDLAFLTELPKRAGESVRRHRLQQFNRLLVEALESARDGVMITDSQGVILHVNQALEHMTGYQRDELIGQTPRLLKSGVHPPETYAAMWKAVLARTSWQGELANRRKDGGLVEVSLALAPIDAGLGQPLHFVGIHRDISERKQLERQLVQAQKLQSIGTLASGVAHEFNNLLAGITGYASLGLDETDTSAIVRSYLEQIIELTDRAAGLTRQLLAFARKPPLHRKLITLDDLLRNTAEFVTRSLRLTVNLEIVPPAAGVVPLVDADSGQLQQALVNLAFNARDAQDAPLPLMFRLRHEVLSEVRSGFPDAVLPGDYVVLEVADSGCGMTPEVLNQALDPFFTTKDVGQGTGLGLPVVFGIVHAHGGFLTIDTAPGRGTCVGLHLPRIIPATPDQQDSPTALKRNSGMYTIPRPLLVVCEEETVRELFSRLLDQAGHRVVCSSRESDPVVLLRREPKVELIVVDLTPSATDAGVALVERLRQERPELPVLLCGRDVDLESVRPRVTKVAGCLSKPFLRDELIQAVRRVLTGSVG
jgi:PAS domain S-box-containing protein